MSKKPKINKRLDKLFKGFAPEESIAKPTPPQPGALEDVPSLPARPEPVSTSKRLKEDTHPVPARRRTPMPVEAPEPVITQEDAAITYSVNIPTGYQDWSTLRVLDETGQRQWTPDEELLVKQVSDQLSLALENARLFQETERRAREMAALAEVGREVSSTLNIENVLEKISEYAKNLLEAETSAVYLPDPQGLTWQAISAVGLDAEEIKNDPIKTGNGILGKIPLTRTGRIVNNASRQTESVVIAGTDIKESEHLMVIPILAQDRVTGLMAVWRTGEGKDFKDIELNFLNSLGQQAGIALENARLFQEAQKFKLGIDRTDNAVFITDPNGVIQYINPGFEKVYGFTSEEALGKTPRIIKSGLIPDEQYKHFWERLLSGGTVTSEIVNKSKDGRLINIAGTNSPIQDENGKIIGFLSVHQDITERKKSEDALAKSEADLRALFSSMEDIVLVVDKDGRYLRIAPTNPSRLVRPPEELLGRLMHDVMPKETADLGVAAIKKTLEGSESVQLEYDLQIDNETIWFLANLTKLDENNVFWVARDITERKKSEEAIRRRNEYLAASAEISKIITSTLDLNTIFARTVNLINERFNFYHAGIFIVEETGFIAALQEASGEAGKKMKERRHTLQINDKSIVGKVTMDGQPVIVNDVAADPFHKFNPLLPETRAEAAIPLRIGSRIIGALDIQSKETNAFSEDDISVIQTLADQVAVAIDNARSFKLSQEAVMEMREIDRIKSQFLANMSHELRTPLNSIIGFSRVIIKGIDGPVTELQQQDLTAIYNSGQHLLGLINDILDLSKIEAGKMELAFDEVNISDITNSVLSTMSGLIKDKPIQMKRLIQPDLPTVRADAIRIRQVMINLLSNAAKFTDEGDIVMEVSVQLGVAGRREVRVSVTDTGPGIAPQDQEKLFQPFSQVDDSPTRKTGGTGLGLSICQHIINMHGGKIWVEVLWAKGAPSTLPCHSSARKAPPRSAPAK